MADEEFDMQPVESGNLAGIGFNEEKKQIRIAFNSGSTYEYDGCTAEEYNGILNAPSANDAFNETLRGKKPYRKVM